MPRRRKAPTTGNLDSLMDTMTNVVGILVILLVLTQLSVGDAVKRIRNVNEALPDIDEATLAETKAQATSLRKFIEENDKLAEDAEKHMANNDVQWKKLKQDIEQMKKKVATDPKLAAALGKVKKNVDDRKKKADELTKQIADSGKQVQDLKSMLDKTPVPKVPQPKVVTLPNPQPAPKGWTQMLVLCKDGRLFELDYQRVQKTAQQRIERNRKMQIKEDSENTGGFDEKQVIAFFDRDVIKHTNFKITVKTYYKNIPYIVFNPREGAGETAETVGESGSTFHRLLARARSQRKYLRFYVYDDSFEVYLAARNVTDERGIPAGWLPLLATTTPWHTRLGDAKFYFNRPKAEVAKEKAAAEKRAAEAAKKPKPPSPKPSRVPPPKAKAKKATVID